MVWCRPSYTDTDKQSTPKSIVQVREGIIKTQDEYTYTRPQKSHWRGMAVHYANWLAQLARHCSLCCNHCTGMMLPLSQQYLHICRVAYLTRLCDAPHGCACHDFGLKVFVLQHLQGHHSSGKRHTAFTNAHL